MAAEPSAAINSRRPIMAGICLSRPRAAYQSNITLRAYCLQDQDRPDAVLRGRGMSRSGQKAKYSLGADVFRCTPGSGHRVRRSCRMGQINLAKKDVLMGISEKEPRPGLSCAVTPEFVLPWSLSQSAPHRFVRGLMSTISARSCHQPLEGRSC